MVSQSNSGWVLPKNVTELLNFIGGKRTAPKQPLGLFKNFEPATGELFCEVPASSAADVDEAVLSAAAAFPAWSKLTGLERGKILQRAAEIMREHVQELAKLETKDNGKSLYEARVDLEYAADTFTYYGSLAASLNGECIPCANGNFAYTRREPYGVVGAIGAWNYPFQTCSWKVAPALACGNTMVYKPSPLAVVTPVLLAEIVTAAGAPLGTINIVQGEAATGEELCRHPKVAKVSFTGSIPTGQKIMQYCTVNGLRPVTLELGGKSPLLIFEDANLENAVKGAMMANFFTQGEVCCNAARVYVHRSIIGKFTEAVLERVRALRIGDPMLEDTRVGALISRAHMEKVLGYIASAKEQGAKILFGGQPYTPADERCKGGFFISPCVITDATDEMDCVKEEIFGPVMCILPFDTEEEVVRRANNTRYGLAAGLFSKDSQRTHRVASQLQAGFIWVNTYNQAPVEVPFGGYKMSGFGRELGTPAMHQYTQVKSVFVELGDVESPI